MELSGIMRDKELRREFGLRIKNLRKQRKWTQKELATNLGVRFAQLNKYESGLHIPPVEKLIQIAEVFDTTVDYLLTGERTNTKPLHNLRLLERFRALENCDAEDQETVIKLIDAMIVKHKVEVAIKPLERQAG